ncbi:hypothetical protein C5167_005036 [Papaver somniferum]|uniref:Uncharacterized protein n=1 Tax=Papaver somniferum TaxID=3469 RepID=A0A4Y7JCJ6_PAPSO|nr:hypothetical protein C5167_005036 [Papaver somniferum]
MKSGCEEDSRSYCLGRRCLSAAIGSKLKSQKTSLIKARVNDQFSCSYCSVTEPSSLFCEVTNLCPVCLNLHQQNRLYVLIDDFFGILETRSVFGWSNVVNIGRYIGDISDIGPERYDKKDIGDTIFAR